MPVRRETIEDVWVALSHCVCVHLTVIEEDNDGEALDKSTEKSSSAWAHPKTLNLSDVYIQRRCEEALSPIWRQALHAFSSRSPKLHRPGFTAADRLKRRSGRAAQGLEGILCFPNYTPRYVQWQGPVSRMRPDSPFFIFLLVLMKQFDKLSKSYH